MLGLEAVSQSWLTKRQISLFWRSRKLDIFNFLWHMGPSFVHVCNFGISDPFDIARVSPKNFSLFLFCVDLPERDSAGPIIALLARSGRALTWKPLHSFFLSGSVDGKDCAHLFTRSLEKASAVAFEEVRFSFVIATILSLQIIDQLLPIWRFCACTFLA